ncbi:hypothetical protein D3C81_2342530 [compost metagenome]
MMMTVSARPGHGSGRKNGAGSAVTIRQMKAVYAYWTGPGTLPDSLRVSTWKMA